MRALALPLLTVALLTGCASHGFYQWQGSTLAGSPTNLEKRARNVRDGTPCASAPTVVAVTRPRSDSSRPSAPAA